LKPLKRRSFLLGACGSLIALPLLESMFASDRVLAAVGTRPLRFTFMFYPNGSVEYEMSPTSLNQLNGVLEPFAAFRDQLISVNGLNNRDNSTWEINGVDLGGGTPHEINAATFLTCQKLGSLDELQLSPSIDQLIGAELQKRYSTRLASVVVGDGVGGSGIGQGGVNQAYHHLMSWKTTTQYVTPISRAPALFAQLFGDDQNESASAELTAARAQRRSILDSTTSQYQAMKRRVGKSDQARLELYLETIRQVETQLDATTSAACPTGEAPIDYNPKNQAEFPAYLDTMSDLIVLALQCQVSPVAVFQLSRGNGGVRSGVAGVEDDQHSVSHYRSNDSVDSLRKINQFYNQRAAYFLNRLASVEELGQTLLDSTVTLYGTGIADADRHDGSNCAILIAGGGAHGVVGNRVIDHELRPKDYGEGTPLANLHLGFAQLAGVELGQFGNSTGAIALTD
jgi:Protein of unknown function (DUF1552)